MSNIKKEKSISSQLNGNKKRTNEGISDYAEIADKDHEVQMARSELYKLAEYAIKLHDMLKSISEAEGLEGWQQAKITKASDYISSVYHALSYEKQTSIDNQPAMDIAMASRAAKESTDPYKSKLHSILKEKAKSKAQQQAAGIALAAKKKGKKPSGKGAAASMSKMSKKDLEDFAGTKHKGLPKKKNESIKENLPKELSQKAKAGYAAGRASPQGIEAMKQAYAGKAPATPEKTKTPPVNTSPGAPSMRIASALGTENDALLNQAIQRLQQGQPLSRNHYGPLEDAFKNLLTMDRKNLQRVMSLMSQGKTISPNNNQG